MAWRVVVRLLIAAPLAVLLVHYGTEFLSVDSCLDSGGVYNYTHGRCRTDVQTLPYVPYLARHCVFSTIVAVVSLGGVILFVSTRRKPTH